MTSGRRDQLVELQRAGTTQDQYGEEIQAWPPDGGSILGTEWAAIFYGRGDERRQAAMEQGSQAATFQMLSNPITRALTVKDRIEYEGNWDIEGIAPDMPKRGYIEIAAVRSA